MTDPTTPRALLLQWKCPTCALTLANPSPSCGESESHAIDTSEDAAATILRWLFDLDAEGKMLND